jgi:hypothetical protein
MESVEPANAFNGLLMGSRYVPRVIIADGLPGNAAARIREPALPAAMISLVSAA